MSLLDRVLQKVSTSIEDADNNFYRTWEMITMLPGGRYLFSKAIGLYVPYTGSISAYVEELNPGHARVSLSDHRKVRNHLNSIHAMALANLIELTGNMAIYSNLPADGRLILKGIEAEYEKKARGTVTAEASVPNIDASQQREHEVDVTVTDSDGDVTTRGTLTTLVGPKQ
jgi:acyl-coenzyme A thioesterase PaaI-like protein